MKFTIMFAVILATTLSGVGVRLPQKKAVPARTVIQAKNRPPTIESFTSSSMDLDLCPGAESSTCRNEVIFSLEVKASDLDGDALSYHYSATTGVISGDGPLVNWELAKVGSHSATVEVTDGKGGRVSAAVIGVVRPCTTCDPPRPFISVTCPSNVTEGQVVIFTANISGSDQNDKLSYDWRVANGQVDQGQGTPTLKVKATGAVGESVTATVDVQGLDPSVNREASCSSEIQKPR